MQKGHAWTFKKKYDSRSQLVEARFKVKAAQTGKLQLQRADFISLHFHTRFHILFRLRFRLHSAHASSGKVEDASDQSRPVAIPVSRVHVQT
jgi:hypothetical protein